MEHRDQWQDADETPPPPGLVTLGPDQDRSAAAPGWVDNILAWGRTQTLGKYFNHQYEEAETTWLRLGQSPERGSQG